MKKRVDVLLVERGLAATRSQAQGLVLAGRVKGHAKPGEQVEETTEIELLAGRRFVSRGGDKLRRALDLLGVDPTGADCLDVGASTGGFTDCLLAAGARHVVALDVGYGQLDPRLRSDPRVTAIERTNVRLLRCADLPYAPTLVTCDVSFIGVRTALPPALRCAAPGWEALVLVKPQFEAGRAAVGKGGVVRDPGVRRTVVAAVARAAAEWRGRFVGACDSGLPGPKGNREYFLHVVESDVPATHDEVEAVLDGCFG